MRAHIMDWFADLKASAAESDRLRTLDREAEAVKLLVTERQRVKPLPEQITDLMNSLPPALRDRPWSMAELVSRLQGKYRARPHPQKVGETMRRLGWKRIRSYGNFEGVRLWIPK